MANNLIQIKRSLNTAIPGSLANGEFAFTSNGDILYIGANGAIVPVAGKRVPGTLTANQALVANSTSGIDKIIVANAAISQLNANGSSGTSGQVLKSAGPGGNTFWATETAGVAGANTQVQYNDSGSLAGASGFTYDKTTNAISMSNTLGVVTSVSSNSFITGSGLGQATAGSTSNTTVIGVSSNSTVNSTQTATLIQVANSTASANHTALGFSAGISTVNTTVVAVGSNNFMNATAIDIGNSVMTSTLLTLGGQVNANGGVGSAGQVLTSGASGNAYWTTPAAGVAGSDTQIQYNDGGVLAGAAGFTFAKASNNVTVANNLSVTANVASNNYTAGAGFGGATAGVTVNSGAVGISSNTTVNASLTSSLLQVSNSTATANLSATGLVVGVVTANSGTLKVGNTTLTTTNAVFGGTIAANGGIGSAGQALISGGGANAYWSTIGNGTVTSVATGNGITGGTITSTGTLSAVAGVGVAVNTTGIHVLANSGILANSTGTFVNANTSGGLLANTTLQVKIGTGLVFDGTGNVAVNSAALSFQDLTVSGNLTVLGDLVSMNVSTLAIEDSLITLAKDQSSTTSYTDAVDIGFIAPYGNTATANANWTGLFRDQNDSGIYKLFSGNIPTPTTTVDTSNVNFAYSTLQAYLRTGGAGASGLIANSTTIAITANSTLNVAIVANTLSLATALPTTSGGTGTSTYSVGDLLVGNTSNSLTKLAAGTDGYVLQINGTGVVAWNTLDGGTF